MLLVAMLASFAAVCLVALLVAISVEELTQARLVARQDSIEFQVSIASMTSAAAAVTRANRPTTHRPPDTERTSP